MSDLFVTSSDEASMKSKNKPGVTLECVLKIFTDADQLPLHSPMRPHATDPFRPGKSSRSRAAPPGEPRFAREPPQQPRQVTVAPVWEAIEELLGRPGLRSDGDEVVT